KLPFELPLRFAEPGLAAGETLAQSSLERLLTGERGGFHGVEPADHAELQIPESLGEVVVRGAQGRELARHLLEPRSHLLGGAPEIESELLQPAVQARLGLPGNRRAGLPRPRLDLAGARAERLQSADEAIQP